MRDRAGTGGLSSYLCQCTVLILRYRAIESRYARGLVVNIMREVHVYFLSANVGVLGRVDTSEILVLDEDWDVCRGQRGEGERALKVLAGRWMV